jgi:hypothetical protein
MWIERKITSRIQRLAESRPAVLVTGARQVGKSSLLQRLFADAEYVTLDRVATAEYAEQNPDAFLSSFKQKVILDEIQYAPSLFRELKIRIDQQRKKYGQWILTGSQKFQLMKDVSDSLAGRIGIVDMHTLCAEEILQSKRSAKVTDLLWKGGYPELWSNPKLQPNEFFQSYVQTYLERDLKALVNVVNLRDFQRFMRLLAMRVGQLLNYADLAKDVGVAPASIKSWIGALEASGVVVLLAPYFRNLGKRLIKSPKVYFVDNGLLCFLLGIETQASCLDHLHIGAIWENLVFTELLKSHDFLPNQELFYYRDQNGVEIDFLIEKNQQVSLIEAKASEQVDAKKLNFKKVAPLFDQKNSVAQQKSADVVRNVRCYVAARINEKKMLHLKDYALFNPLWCCRLSD